MADKRRRYGSSSRAQPVMNGGQGQRSQSSSSYAPDLTGHGFGSDAIPDAPLSGMQKIGLHAKVSRSQSPLMSQQITAGHSPPKSEQKRPSPQGAFPRPAIPATPRAAGPPVLAQSRPPLSKVAIPRIRRNSEATASSAGVDKHRVSHACEPCRHRKVKCSGERPTCHHCRDFDIVCVYGDGKRDKFKRDYARLVSKNQGYEELLRDLSSRVCAADQASIRKFIESPSIELDESLQSPDSQNFHKRARKESDETSSDEPKRGEREVSAGVGSNESGDILDEDLNKTEETRATGYIGKNSEIAWMRRLKKEVAVRDSNTDSRSKGPYGPPGDSAEAAATRIDRARERREADGAEPPVKVSESTYHCDDINILIQDQVDPYQIPPKESAERLFQCYLDSVHDDFPIIGRKAFSGQFKKYFKGLEDGSPIRLPYKWRAILNLIFAIGARYSHLTKAEWRGDDRDHLLYFTRARMLGMHGDSMVNHPDLQQVQIAGLLAFYFTCINQVSRAWLMSGFAVRCALALGLNLRNEDPTVGLVPKEIRVRVWWAVYSHERLLGVMTGRPTAIADEGCTVPLPVPFDEDELCGPMGQMHVEDWSTGKASMLMRAQSHDSHASVSSNSQSGRQPSASGLPAHQQTSGLPTDLPAPNLAMYFRFQVQLDLITQAVTLTLYSGGTVRKSWADVQKLIQYLDSKLEAWKSSFPAMYDFTKGKDPQHRREKMALGLAYWSTKILLSRPCVCRIDRRIKNQSDASKDFNQTWAKTCVHAAESMLLLIPDVPNPPELYKVVPWWCFLHYLMQAATVLMLELSFKAYHMPEELSDIMKSITKVVTWLQKMSEDSIAAERAWKMCVETLQKVACKANVDVSGIIMPTADSTNFMDIDFDVSIPWSPFNTRQEGETSQAPEYKHHSHSYYGGPMHGNPDHYQYPMYTSYDQFLPFLQTAGPSQDHQQQQDGLFPTSISLMPDSGNITSSPNSLLSPAPFSVLNHG